MSVALLCPICKKKVAFSSPEMPFCSERCRLIDLANWADGKYVISTPSSQEEDGSEEDSEAGEGSSR